LTLRNHPRNSNGKVFPISQNFYARCRAECGLATALRENDGPPPERLLQSIWQHQRIQRDQLTTLDGQTVRILHPGFLNREGGPDFRGAVIQFGDAAPLAGDIEVDLEPAGWHAHRHDRNPAFRNVILHVLWDGRLDQLTGPVALALRRKLDAPLGELSLWLNSDASDLLPDQWRGQCCAPLRDFDPELLSTLLRQTAQIRFRAKAAQLQARARQAGWEQALWEGLFRALGYKHNAWPMQWLAEQRQQWLGGKPSAIDLQSRLLGLAGLLPAELSRSRSGADKYLRRAWDLWWRERHEFADCLLPRSVWRFHGQRPANHPQRRLALAAHWLAAGDLVDNLERWGVENPAQHPAGGEASAASLLTLLQVKRDDFWSWHWTLRSPRLKKPQPLLGATRVTDLAVNVILPWLWIRACEGKNEALQSVLEQRFENWPAAEDNAILRLARQRLLAGSSRGLFRSAAEQQGLMQIVRDFCDHSNAVCAECRFPELVLDWKSESVASDV
jgi:hypothetical protein